MLTATALVVTYYALPISGHFDAWAAAVLVFGLLAFLIMITWQVRAILQADYPGLRTIEALSTALALFLLVFATAYVLLAGTSGAFSESLSKTDALYFTVTVFATVGFGDIVPRTGLTRIVVMLQMLADLVVVGLVVRIMVNAVRQGIQRRTAAEEGTERD
jgi:hypothetical protein